jgi:hypothetical protein
MRLSISFKDWASAKGKILANKSATAEKKGTSRGILSMGNATFQNRIMAEAGQASEQAVDAAAVKLLTSRTYQLLAAELETTKFQVES